MPMTAVELCNTALLKIGAAPIDSFEDATAEADCARRLYPIVRDGLLSAHPWSFTRQTAQLTPEPGRPVADFAYAYALPADHLRSLSVGSAGTSRGAAYRVQGSQILSDMGSLVLAYQRRSDESEFPAFFAQLLVSRLAAEFCIPLTEGTSRAMELFRLAEAELRVARLLDSQQSTPQRVDDFTLLKARWA